MSEEEIEKLARIKERYDSMIERLDELFDDGELGFDQYFYLVGGSYDG